ncbi:MAG: hypothetical protein ACLP59_15445 [Bryobacteraceae bacterium]
MGNTVKLAVRILSVCVPCAVIAGRPLAAQQPGAPQSQSPAAGQQAAAPPSTPPPPPPVITPPGSFIGGQGVSITVQGFEGIGHPMMGTGHLDTNVDPSTLDFGGRPRLAETGILSIPIGKKQHHTLRFSYFRVQGFGNPTAPQDLIIYGTQYYQGDYLATHYTMQNAKVTLDYLSWPFPVKDSKFHVKTLWEVQTVTFSGGLDAPLRHGTTDASGNPIETVAQGLDWFVFPSFGLGVDYQLSHPLRFEARASGFIFPHRSTIYDAEASLNYRFGKFEIQGGLKTFHFKTSPENTEFVYASYPGVYVGLRWYPTYSSR